MADVELLAAGLAYGGWKGLRLRRGVEVCAGSFQLGVSELWPGQETQARIRPGDACSVALDGVPVITGYVDEVDMRISERRHEVRVSGRDKTADLVDCSAVRKPGQWRGQKIERIAADLATPFGVDVRADVDTGKPLASFALQEGETVFEAIERAARVRALLLMTDGAGRLRITRAGNARVSTALVLGVNVLDARVSLDMRDRFSHYTTKGQAPGSDFFSGAQVSQQRSLASDPAVLRHRPLVLVNDCPDVSATLLQRAQWEANVRAARSTKVEVQVQGWSHRDGLWEPNTLVAVNLPPLRIEDELLVCDVQYSLGERGRTTTLSLTRADAYSLLPLTSKEASATGGFWHLPKPQEKKAA